MAFKTYLIQMDEELYDQFKKYADDNNMTRSRLLKSFIKDLVKDIQLKYIFKDGKKVINE